jgi:hypothetical protein
MKMVGHKTESVYRRYAIVDETMLRTPRRGLQRIVGKVLGEVGWWSSSRCHGTT